MPKRTQEPRWGRKKPANFGDELKKLVNSARVGGMPGIERIGKRAYGFHFPGHSTLNGLYKLEEAPTSPKEPEGFRAWAVITICDDDPAAWEIPDTVIPDGFGPAERVRKELEQAKRHFSYVYAPLAA